MEPSKAFFESLGLLCHFWLWIRGWGGGGCGQLGHSETSKMSDTPGEGMTRRCWWPTCNIICIFLHILRAQNMSIRRIEKEGYIDLHAFWKNGSLYPSLGRKKRRGPSRIGSWLKINTQWRWFGIHIPKLYGQILYLKFVYVYIHCIYFILFLYPWMCDPFIWFKCWVPSKSIRKMIEAQRWGWLSLPAHATSPHLGNRKKMG